MYRVVLSDSQSKRSRAFLPCLPLAPDSDTDGLMSEVEQAETSR